jgi:hypothetical protein
MPDVALCQGEGQGYEIEFSICEPYCWLLSSSSLLASSFWTGFRRAVSTLYQPFISPRAATSSAVHSGGDRGCTSSAELGHGTWHDEAVTLAFLLIAAEGFMAFWLFNMSFLSRSLLAFTQLKGELYLLFSLFFPAKIVLLYFLNTALSEEKYAFIWSHENEFSTISLYRQITGIYTVIHIVV